jgi:formylmethanofuran dehydrogenase subunit E
MTMLKQSIDTELMSLIKKAADFHGHLGPFLVLGVRMGLVGVRELGAKENAEKLHVTVMLNYSVPFSCVIDGIQVATKCTVGNKKLRVKNSSGMAAKFELQNRRYVSVAVNPVAFNKLKKEVRSEKVSSEELRELAQLVASMPEEELFIVGRR